MITMYVRIPTDQNIEVVLVNPFHVKRGKEMDDNRLSIEN
jgi:hypothetical protein